MDITLTITPADLETIVACLKNRIYTIGWLIKPTRKEMAEREGLLKIVSELEIQAIRNTNPATAETSGK